MNPRLLGAAAALLCLCLSPAAEAGRQDFTFRSERSFPATNAPVVAVYNWAGRVQIIGDQIDSIRVIQYIVIPAADSAWAETFLEEVETTYDHAAEQLSITARILESKQERLFLGGLMGLHDPGRGEVHFHLRVPSACRVAIGTRTGTIDIQAMTGDVQCDSRSGSQHLADIQGRVVAHSKSGKIVLADCIAPNIKLSTESGAITVTRGKGEHSLATTSGKITARDIDGDCLITATTANVHIEEMRGHLRTRTTSGAVRANLSGAGEIRTGSGDVHIEIRPGHDTQSSIQTATGAIHLNLPGATGVDLALKTSSGNLIDDLGVSWQNRTRHERTGRLAGGGALVQVETASGDIHLGGIL